MALPQHAAYAGGAERARWHVEEAVRVHTRAFGAPPAGCWPSEGAISAATLELLGTAGGFRWAASSSAVLRGSLALSDPQAAADPLAYNRPYRLAGTGMNCFFRDDSLSDLIGFTYATWHGDDAAHNLVNELSALAQRYDGSSNHALLIALDGENAWEHYPFNGYYFLRALYALLADHPRFELTTLSECLARGIQPAPLPRVLSGSWVHGTLATWMGDAAKNRAWDLLCDAKSAYDRVMLNMTDPAQRAQCGRQLALCESSDWFWWFGDYNPAEAVMQFDRLYRRQLVTLYRRLEPRAARGAGAADLRRRRHGRARRRHAPRQRLKAHAAHLSARLPVFDRRRAGVLLPLSALEAPLGRGGRAFIDWLARGGFSVWQVLPLGPTGADGSPYWVRSDFAGNPALLDPASCRPRRRRWMPHFLAATAGVAARLRAL